MGSNLLPHGGRALAACALLISALGSQPKAAGTPVPSRTPAEPAATLRASGGGYAIQLRQTTIPAAGAADAASWWGGPDARTVRPPLVVRAVSRIRVTWHGRQVRIPRSVYADLADVDRVSVARLGGGCRVRVEGGDASTAYAAEIVIRGSDVVERTVRSAEFPGHFWERTRYVNRRVRV